MAGSAPFAWCGHPRLRRGESLAWWLHRVAWANGLTNHTLVTHLIGGRAIWPRDVDRFAPKFLLDACSTAFGEPVERIAHGTLRRYEGVLFPQLSLNGWLPWVVPVGVFHRTQRHHGQAFCPQCLKEDRPIPIAGRLAMEVACDRHRAPLRDGCPRCDAPITFSRVALGRQGRYACPSCGHNLASSAPVSLSNRALGFQHRCHHALRSGVTRVGAEQITAASFFLGARVLLRGLYGRGRLSGLTDATQAKRLRWPVTQSPPDTPFEQWRIVDRERALVALESYLRAWPDRFVADALRAGVYRCRFDSRQRLAEPGWLSVTMDLVEARRDRS